MDRRKGIGLACATRAVASRAPSLILRGKNESLAPEKKYVKLKHFLEDKREIEINQPKYG
jgi:hypothetical protein